MTTRYVRHDDKIRNSSNNMCLLVKWKFRLFVKFNVIRKHDLFSKFHTGLEWTWKFTLFQLLMMMMRIFKYYLPVQKYRF